jgi:hypothetical protein
VRLETAKLAEELWATSEQVVKSVFDDAPCRLSFPLSIQTSTNERTPQTWLR